MLKHRNNFSFCCVDDSAYTAYPCTVFISCHKLDAGLFLLTYLLFGE
jgi:hypothetical protein